MILKCPMCGRYASIIVIDSRETVKGFGVKRRRECMLCKKRFTTIERMVVNEVSKPAAGSENPQK